MVSMARSKSGITGKRSNKTTSRWQDGKMARWQIKFDEAWHLWLDMGCQIPWKKDLDLKFGLDRYNIWYLVSSIFHKFFLCCLNSKATDKFAPKMDQIKEISRQDGSSLCLKNGWRMVRGWHQKLVLIRCLEAITSRARHALWIGSAAMQR